MTQPSTSRLIRCIILKKGGRITPAAAALGTILRLKPVLQIQGEKLDAYSKARTYKIAKNTMLDAIAKDIEERFDGKSSPEDIYIAIAHTDNLAAAEEFRDEVKAIYPEHDIYIDHLSLSVACHIGPGSTCYHSNKSIKILISYNILKCSKKLRNRSFCDLS